MQSAVKKVSLLPFRQNQQPNQRNSPNHLHGDPNGGRYAPSAGQRGHQMPSGDQRGQQSGSPHQGSPRGGPNDVTPLMMSPQNRGIPPMGPAMGPGYGPHRHTRAAPGRMAPYPHHQMPPQGHYRSPNPPPHHMGHHPPHHMAPPPHHMAPPPHHMAPPQHGHRGAFGRPRPQGGPPHSRPFYEDE